MDHTNWLTPQEVATEMEVNIKTVYEWINLKKLKVFRPINGGKARTRRVWLESMINEWSTPERVK